MVSHKRDILKGLLERVTPDQLAFFKKMYFPHTDSLTIEEMCGVLEVEKVSHAITQCENTIKKNSVKEKPLYLFDMNDVLLRDGDIIDLHQTVNGENLFVVLNVQNLDIRYKSDFRKYEYDAHQLLNNKPYESEWEIIGNFF